GPKSNVQITDGEVTLRPVEELIEILRHTRSVGGIPMIMTHGDNLRRREGLLERLMTEGGLTEVSIHIDITQRGRDGHKAPTSERELMGLREDFAERIRAARKATGRPLRAAMTLTVTRQNLGQIADVVRWTIANNDAFGLISFQPLAPVGRTRKNLSGVTPDELWGEIDRATAEHGAPPTGAGAFHFGHPACTRFAPFLTFQRPGEPARLFPMIRETPEDQAIVAGFFARGLGGVAFRDDRPLEAVGRAAGILRTAPGWFLGTVRRWAAERLREEAGTTPARLAADLLRGKVRAGGLTLTSHHFMGPAELATDLGRERLAACVFRLPVGDRLVGMCEMNAAGVREEFYAGIGRSLLPVLSAELAS
ncbi:MAG TPA: hypothetical protein VN783_06245, partial [Thermoanaerobaculia bacterium]|nr:hypothetical protein [Thermoanaerobaculia bacterium]